MHFETVMILIMIQLIYFRYVESIPQILSEIHIE